MATGAEVLKTYKLYIGGAFPRSESGRHHSLKNKQGKLVANVCLASRKDFKNAVVAARNAVSDWQERPAFNRSQILYRMAEMLEGRKEELKRVMVLTEYTVAKAEKEIRRATDCLIHYAGWCDKFQQVFSSVNPVSSPHYNFSVPEPMGVVVYVAPEKEAFIGFIENMAAIIAGGNTCVILASETQSLSALTFAEILATSDLPAGVVNILSGDIEELHQLIASHMDVNAILYLRENKIHKKNMMQACATNVKRWVTFPQTITHDHLGDPYKIMAFQEIKTTWHPIEKTGNAGTKY